MLSRLIPPAALVAVGLLLAALVQTSGSDVEVRDVRFAGANGNMMSALLYRPRAASPQNPAPGILAVHGYINSRETQSGFAIEFARRGFVVLALDQTGHGYSDPPAFAHGFGGPDGLAYLRSLAFVDKDRIGLEGHSMGGWTVQLAAAADPDGYTSMVLEGSSTGTFGAPAGTASDPKNLLVVFSLFDEFSALMWGAPVPADIVGTDKLKTLFGTDETIEVGKAYGDPDVGTARKLLMPAVTHPGDHLSTEAIGAAAEWFELTLGHDAGIEGQIWYWKELGTLLALIGLMWLVFPLLDLLLVQEVFVDVTTRRRKPAVTTSRRAWVILATVAALVPVITFFPLQILGGMLLPPNSLWPQQITNGIVVWALGTALVNLCLFAIWYRSRRPGLEALGIVRRRYVAIYSAALAVLVAAVILVIVALAEFMLNVDFRFWVVALKSPSPMQLVLIFLYLPFFAAFFLILNVTFHEPLRRGLSLRRTMLLNGVILSGGFFLLLLVQYIPLFAGGTLLIASQPLLTIVAFQFVPILFFVGMLSTFLLERTGNVYTGTALLSLLVTWYIVAGTATQVVPFWHGWV